MSAISKVPFQYSSGNITDDTAKTIIAGASGLSTYIRSILITNGSASVSTWVQIFSYDGSDDPIILWEGFCMAGGGGYVQKFSDGELKALAEKDLKVICETDGSDIVANVTGYQF